MDEIQANKSAEDEAFGAWLLETIAMSVGVKADPKRIDRAIYKGTSCGAWVRFDEKGIIVGTIVEGSDAEFSKRIDLNGLIDSENAEAILTQRFWDALQECEDFSNEVWAEMDAEAE